MRPTIAGTWQTWIPSFVYIGPWLFEISPVTDKQKDIPHTHAHTWQGNSPNLNSAKWVGKEEKKREREKKKNFMASLPHILAQDILAMGIS